MTKETKTTETDNKPALTNELVVEARIAYALDAIEDAQNKLYEACRAVSSIIGFAPECRTIGNLGSKAKDLWHKIDAAQAKKRSKLKLDREPNEKYDAKYLRAL